MAPEAQRAIAQTPVVAMTDGLAQGGEGARRRPLSLSLRLTVFIGIAVTVILLGFGWVIERLIAHHFAIQDTEELQVVQHAVALTLEGLAPEDTAEARSQKLANAVQGHENIFYLVADLAGRTVYARPGAALAPLLQHPTVSHLDVNRLHTWVDAGRSYRGAVLDLAAGTARGTTQGTSGSGSLQGPYKLVVAADIGFHQHFLHHFQQTIWLATALAVMLAIGATWLAVYQGHAPLRRVSARIRGVSADQLHVRLAPQAVPIELAELTHAFNAMLERIEQDFRQLSHFSADIAHELRTPVTNLITQTQVLLAKERGIDAYREALYSSLEEYERMAKMIGDMLYLAQTDNQLIRPDSAEVDLHTEVHGLIEYFEPWAEERQVRLRLSGQTPPVRGDRLMLRRAVSNLLSNAIRHAPAGETVTIGLLAPADRPGEVALEVRNPGETIPAEHLPHLFDRFYRVDPSRQRNGDGAGLGLAIVKSIVEAHGGTVDVASDAGVTCFTIRLPEA